MKICIMGASCAGSTTLGTALSERLNIPYFDTDNYFWEPSATPYTVRREPALRNKLLKDDCNNVRSFIIGGSLISWGEEWKHAFDLVVFLYLPPEIRLARLQARELERYGNVIYTDPQRNQLYQDFMAWAAKYDDPTFTGRNIKLHEDWLHDASAKKLEIRGDTSVAERVERVMDVL